MKNLANILTAGLIFLGGCTVKDTSILANYTLNTGEQTTLIRENRPGPDTFYLRINGNKKYGEFHLKSGEYLYVWRHGSSISRKKQSSGKVFD